MKWVLFIMMAILISAVSALAQDTPPDTSAAPQVHPTAKVYSEGYETRLKIHKIASYATLPLFAAEVALGESLYKNPQETGASKGLHAVIGTGIVGLFGVNTVTGGMNMWEARHDPDHRTIKVLHSTLMLVADAGFAATVMTTPRNSNRPGFVDTQTNRVAHRDLALGSVGIATASYLLMLFGHH